MKVLLVKPYNKSDHIQPSLGLAYLASAIRKAHDVEILDCIREDVPPSRVPLIVKQKNADVVGVQCYTFDLPNIENILKGIKAGMPQVVTVLGGPHPSAAPVETMEKFGESLDFAFAGEAEKGFPKLLDLLEKGDSKGLEEVEGLVWRSPSGIKTNQRYLEEDLDSLGLPAWDLIKPQDYPQAQHGAFFKKFPIAPIMVTRGCPFVCSFCAGNLVAGKKIRRHSIDYVLNEASVLYRDYGIREFHIVDDNFTIDKAFAKALLRGLIDLKLDISWATPNGIRMETLDDEMLELMKKSGLYLISLGVESGSDTTLKAMEKGLTRRKIVECIRRIRRHKIPIAGFFILGYIGETEKDIKRTIYFSLRLGLVRANYFNFLPFPGTSSYKRIQKEEGLSSVDFDRFFFTDVAYAPKGISPARLKKLQQQAFLRFYLRPRVLFDNLMQVRSFSHFCFLFRRFWRWMVA